MEYKDYYKTLGVPRTADEKEIKKAFRKLAQQCHPDKNPGDQSAEQRFKEINEAYTVLSDAEKRAKYDRFGSQWEQYGHTNGGPNRGGSYQVSPEELDEILRQMGLGGFGTGGARGGGFSSFFDALFGGAGQNMGGFDTDPRRRSDPFGAARSAHRATNEVSLTVTLEEAYLGASRTLENVDGTRFEVNIPRGVKTGSKVRMRGASGQGDIVLKIDVAPHSRFVREDDDLRVRVPVDLFTVVLGGEVQVPTLDRSVMLTIPAGTQGGKSIRLRGLGMPHLRNPDQRGDLLVEVQVLVPQHLNDRERVLFEELRGLRR